MKKLLNISKQFRDDENGAAMVEYSILIGIIAAAAITAIIAIGAWVSGEFTSLCSTLKAADSPAGMGACS